MLLINNKQKKKHSPHLNELPSNQRRLKNLDGAIGYRYSIANVY